MSKIEWTEKTLNLWTGCREVSPGCHHCYARTMAARLKRIGVSGYESGFDTLTIIPERFQQPAAIRKPTLFFLNSMSDTFHPEVPDEVLDRAFEMIRQTPRHTYQILTKRAERMAAYFSTREPPFNMWLGVTVENQRHGLPRLKILRGLMGVSIRFVSMEPLLEHLGPIDLSNIHLVIVGGESGPRARPMHPSWVRNVRDWCEGQGVSFFFKQWGTYGPDGIKRSKQANGRLLDGTLHDLPLMIGRS